jgi:4-hydroxy-tetrahydrodipicolinate reductase
MGERVRAVLADAPDAELVGALEGRGHAALGRELAAGVALTADPSQAFARAQAVIDFSVPAATLAALPAAAEQGVAYVCGTTGFTPAERQELAAFAKRVPLVLAPNFSLAVNVLAHLVGEAARLLPGFDAEIVELHHAAKRDAPSGTALRLAGAIASARGQDLEEALVLAREGETGARPARAIGVQALRGGDNPGEHTVLLVGRGERLELVHRAATRDHFASGALHAARWARGRPPGLYGMEDVLALDRRS